MLISMFVTLLNLNKSMSEAAEFGQEFVCEAHSCDLGMNNK